MANWIIGFFPGHHSYLEPFFGSGAVLFNKPRSNIETVNDLDGNVVNLFDWIRKDPEKLAHRIYYTPYARQVYEEAFSMEPEDSFEKAVNFYIRLNMGHGFRTNGEKVGWKNDVQGRERSYASQYRHEMDDKAHLELLDALSAHKGKVLLSGYDNDLYNDCLRGWHREETTCYSQVCSKKKEVLWMNFEPEIQMSLEL